MAPERFHGRELSAATDVYSLACVLFEALTGRRPFPPGDAVTQMYAHVNTSPPPPSQVRPGLPQVLDGVVLRGLAKDPAERWTSAGGMAAAARAALGVSGIEVPRPAEQPPGPAAPPRPWSAGVLTTAGRPRHWAPHPHGPACSPRPSPARRRGPPSRARPRLAARRRGLQVAVAALAVLAVGLGTWAAIATVRGGQARADLADARQALLAVDLPGDVDAASCTRSDPGDGAVLGLDCGVSPSADGPSGQSYALFGSPEEAAAAFEALVARDGLTQLDGGQLHGLLQLRRRAGLGAAHRLRRPAPRPVVLLGRRRRRAPADVDLGRPLGLRHRHRPRWAAGPVRAAGWWRSEAERDDL